MSAVPAVRFGHWKLICWLVTANSGAAAPFTMICTPPSCVGQGVCVGAGGLAEVKLYPNSVASDPGLQDWSNELLAELYRPRITAWFEVTLTTVVLKLLKPAVSVAETVTGKAPSCVALGVQRNVPDLVSKLAPDGRPEADSVTGREYASCAETVNWTATEACAATCEGLFNAGGFPAFTVTVA